MLIGSPSGKVPKRYRRKNLCMKEMTGLSFWATGYCVSTVGLDEEMIKKYIREQDNSDNVCFAQLGLGLGLAGLRDVP